MCVKAELIAVIKLSLLFFLQEVEYAIEVELSDESKYTVFRTLKEVATFNVRKLIIN